MKVPKFNPIDLDSGAPCKPTDAVKELRAMARRIANGEYGDVRSVHIVIESAGARPMVASYGREVRRDPMLALWRGVKEMARISEPPCRLTTPEPIFESEE